MSKDYFQIESANDEFVMLHKEDGKVAVHIGMYTATFTNKQLDEFIKKLKYLKVYGK